MIPATPVDRTSVCDKHFVLASHKQSAKLNWFNRWDLNNAPLWRTSKRKYYGSKPWSFVSSQLKVARIGYLYVAHNINLSVTEPLGLIWSIDLYRLLWKSITNAIYSSLWSIKKASWFLWNATTFCLHQSDFEASSSHLCNNDILTRACH
jgi:hypothetical protein